MKVIIEGIVNGIGWVELAVIPMVEKSFVDKDKTTKKATHEVFETLLNDPDKESISLKSGEDSFECVKINLKEFPALRCYFVDH